MKITQYILAALFAIVLLFGLGWVAHYNSWMQFSFFAPKMEQARRDTFEQSKAFQDGLIQEMRSMQMEYIQAQSTHKSALAQVILHKSAQLPMEKYPADLQQFLQTLTEERTAAMSK